MKVLSKWGPAIGWMVLIFLLSSLPKEEIPVSGESLSIAAHLIEYGILALLIRRALASPPGFWGRGVPLFTLSLGLTFLYGISDDGIKVSFRGVPALLWIWRWMSPGPFWPLPWPR